MNKRSKKGENNQNRLILPIIIIVGLVSILLVCFINFFNSDALKFKREYEALNNTIRESDQEKYNNVHIDLKNPIKYASIEEVLKLLDSDEAIIYIGANWCPWCRNMLEPMFAVAKKLDITKIYYLNLDNEKSNYEIKDGELNKINNGTKNYYKLLDRLKDYLKDYELTDDAGNSYNTGEKRIYMPFFITVKNGAIASAKEISRTLSSGQTKYSEMTQEQYDDLYNKFYETFKIFSINGTCNVDEGCN